MKKIFGIAIVILTLAACSNVAENDFKPQEEEYITITATLPSKEGDTKAINIDGSVIAANWAVDEEMAVLYEYGGNKKSIARVYEVDGTTGRAKIEFYVPANMPNNTHCTLVYPASAAKDDNTGVKSYAEMFEVQDGTLSGKLDVRVGEGNIVINTLQLDVTTQPEPQYAIFEFRLDFSALVINLKIYKGGDNYNTLTTVYPSSSSATRYYLAVPASTTGTRYLLEANYTNQFCTKILDSKKDIVSGAFYQVYISTWGSVSDNTVIFLNSIPSSTSITVEGRTTLSGSGGPAVKISIADGATVVLNNAEILGYDGSAGLTCLGDATIILSGTNDVQGIVYQPGIYVPESKTLTIMGTGSLKAYTQDKAAGIGAGSGTSCGNIEILSGTINAFGSTNSAGIGGSYSSNCGNITISGGTVTAVGNGWAAGIGGGGGDASNCGNITITSDVTSVTATKGANAVHSIGKGTAASTCGTVTIGGVVGAISESPYTYAPTSPIPSPYAGTDLSKIKNDYLALDGITLTGTLDVAHYPVKISIADGATVTLDNATINGIDDGEKYKWAGLTCEGDATIILKDGTVNTIHGFHGDYPGIFVPEGKTLTITGTGTLNATGLYSSGIGAALNINGGNIIIQDGIINASGCMYGMNGAGIGSAVHSTCGNIEIQGGTVTATGSPGIGAAARYDNYGACGDITISGGTVTAIGGTNSSGIGTEYVGECGNILISGGTVTATGGNYGSGIGAGHFGKVGNITITSGVTKVRATKGGDAPHSIGIGVGGSSSCGTITIGGVVYWNGSDYEDRGSVILPSSPLVYPNTLSDAMVKSARITIEYNYGGSNSCSFTYDGTNYNFVSGTGDYGSNASHAKQMVLDGGNLVFKQNKASDIAADWSQYGFSVTFYPASNKYYPWSGSATSTSILPAFQRIFVNNFEITGLTQYQP